MGMTSGGEIGVQSSLFFVPFGLNIGCFSAPALLLVLPLTFPVSLLDISSESEESSSESLKGSWSWSLKGWVVHCDAASVLGLFAVGAGGLFSKIRRASFSETSSDSPSS
jgi:hypothetical protein